MPKQTEKKFSWKGRPVSKSTFFRRMRNRDLAGLESIEIEQPSADLLPDVDMVDTGPEPGPQPEAPPMVLTDTEVALIGDFMVGLRSGRQIDDRFPVTVAPRLFRAVISALIKAGY